MFHPVHTPPPYVQSSPHITPDVPSSPHITPRSVQSTHTHRIFSSVHASHLMFHPVHTSPPHVQSSPHISTVYSVQSTSHPKFHPVHAPAPYVQSSPHLSTAYSVQSTSRPMFYPVHTPPLYVQFSPHITTLRSVQSTYQHPIFNSLHYNHPIFHPVHILTLHLFKIPCNIHLHSHTGLRQDIKCNLLSLRLLTKITNDFLFFHPAGHISCQTHAASPNHSTCSTANETHVPKLIRSFLFRSPRVNFSRPSVAHVNKYKIEQTNKHHIEETV
jgi:hypothetical protein